MTITINPRLHKNVSARVVIFQEGIFKVRCAVHSQDRRQLFVGEGFAQVRALYLANQDFCAFRYFHAGKLGDGVRRLAHDPGVQRTVNEDRPADFIGLFFIPNMESTLYTSF